MEVRPGYKQTEVGIIPEDWEWERMRDAAANTANAMSTNPTNKATIHGLHMIFRTSGTHNFGIKRGYGQLKRLSLYCPIMKHLYARGARSSRAGMAVRAAFPVTVPVLFGYIAIGIPFGLMLVKAGYPWPLAPVMSINGKVFGKLDRKATVKILKDYRTKE